MLTEVKAYPTKEDVQFGVVPVLFPNVVFVMKTNNKKLRYVDIVLATTKQYENEENNLAQVIYTSCV
jgi:hypothetical protein